MRNIKGHFDIPHIPKNSGGGPYVLIWRFFVGSYLRTNENRSDNRFRDSRVFTRRKYARSV